MPDVTFPPPPPDEVPEVRLAAAPGRALSRAPEATFPAPPPDDDPGVREAPTARAQATAPEAAFPDPPPDEDPGVPEAAAAHAMGAAPAPAPTPAPVRAPVPLDVQEMYRIVRVVAEGHSGPDGYAAVRADPAEGLAFGLALFTQRSGLLGAVLEAMHRRDPVGFTERFGPASPELLATTGASTPEARMRPVDGRPLVDPEWTRRFAEAGLDPGGQAAQNEVAIERQLRPVVPVAMRRGLTTDRGLALAYEAAVTLGAEAAEAWLEGAADASPEALAAAAPPALADRLRRLIASAALDDVPFAA